MHYTVAITEDISGMMYVYFNVNGSKYSVEFTNKGNNETTRKNYDTIYEALSVYQRYVEAFITGCYSYEDRKSWLEEND